VESRQPSNLQQLLSKDEGQKAIIPAFDVKDYAHLALTNFRFSQFFKKPLLFAKFAYYLAQAPDDKEVERILNSNRQGLKELLEVEFKEVTLKMRTITHVTALQLVYGANDREMCETLRPFFTELYGSVEAGRTAMDRQMSELKNTHKLFNFTPIINAISNESFNNGQDDKGRWILSSDTLKAISEFRETFSASQPKIIDKGMQFRWEILKEFSDAYTDAAKRWRYCYEKCALLEDAALMWILLYLPENAKQHCNQGLYYLQKNNPEPFGRKQKVRENEKMNFDESLYQDSVDFVLAGSCVDIIYGRHRPVAFLGDAGYPIRVASFSPLNESFKTFVQQKMPSMQNVCGNVHPIKRQGV